MLNAKKHVSRLRVLLMVIVLLGLAWASPNKALAVPDELDTAQELAGDDNEIDAQMAAQTFQTSKAGRISRLSLWTYSAVANNNVSATVELRQGLPGGGGATLGSATSVFNNMSTAPAWRDFVFAEPVPVLGGTTYHYVLTYTESTGIIRLGYKITSPGASPYAAGDHYTWDTTSSPAHWVPWDDADTAFRVYLALNQEPTVATNSSLPVNEGATATVATTYLNTTDPDGDTVTYTVGTAPVNGTLKKGASALSAGSTFTQTDINSGQLTYMHNGSESTADSFTFTAADGKGGTIGSTTFNFAIAPVNDAPTFTLGSDVIVLEDSSAYSAADFLTGASPIEAGQSILSTTVSNNNNALFSSQPAINGSGTLTFTPAPNAHGTARVTVTVRDNGGTANGGTDQTSQQFSIDITPVNDAPSFTTGANQTVAEDSGAQTASNWATGISVGPNEPTQTVSFLITDNTNAALFSVQPTVDAAGTLRYTPAENANGWATIKLRAKDTGGTANGGSDTSAEATFTITVVAVNDAPTGVDDNLTSMAEDSIPRTIPFATLLANDSRGPADESTQTLSVSAVSAPTGGTVAIVGTDVIFTPTEHFNGPASFTYTVQDNGTVPSTDTATVRFQVTAVNDAPEGADDTLSAVNEDSGPRRIPFDALLANDEPGPAAATDEAGQELTITAVGNAVGGSVSIDGTDVVFTLAANHSGPASFTYTLEETGIADALTDEVTVDFYVNGMAEAPHVSPATTAEETKSTAGLVITPDPSDGAAVTHYQITGITGGSLYKNDGTTPIVNGGYITAAEGAAGLKFLPAANLNTPAGDAFAFSVQAALDGAGAGLSPATTVTITVTEVNDDVTATDDTLADTGEDTAFTIPVAALLANDSKGPANESGQTLTISGFDLVQHGSIAQDGEGNWVFTPEANYAGPASFRYTVADNGTTAGVADAKSDTATVSFTITPVPDAPQITATPTNEDVATTVVILPNAADTAGVTDFVLTGVTGGTLYLEGAPLAVNDAITVAEGAAGLTFAPTPDRNTQADGATYFTVSFKAHDSGRSLTGPAATATVTVNEVNDAPTATPDHLAPIFEDAAAFTITAAELTANDLKGPGNENGQTLKIISVTAVDGGSVHLDEATQIITFTPEADWDEPAHFTYIVEDNGITNGVETPLPDMATVTILVIARVDVPSITPATTAEDTQSTSGLVISRNPKDGAEVTGYKIIGIRNGTVYKADGTTPIATGGTITYAEGSAGLKFTPAANLNQNSPGITFTFSVVAMGAGTSDPVAAVITVTTVNDSPTGVPDDLPAVAEDSGPWTIPFATLTANDSAGPDDEDGQVLTVSWVGGAVGGSVSRSGTDVIFTPNADFAGEASFLYIVGDLGTTDGTADPKDAAASVKVTFDVTPVNDDPVATPDILTSVAEDSAPRIIAVADLLANDKPGPDTADDEDTQSLVIDSVSASFGGTAVLNPAKTHITFTLAQNFNGTARFTYTLMDDGTPAGTHDATVEFDVTPSAEAPNATPATTAEDTLSAPDLKITADPVDGAGVTHFKISGITGGGLFLADGTTQVMNGSFITSAQGNAGLRFRPAANFNTPYGTTFEFTVQAALDAAGTGISPATIATITVTEVNDQPEGEDDTLTFTVAEDSNAHIFPAAVLLVNDRKGHPTENSQTLTVVAVDQPNNVSVSLDVDNQTIRFTPAANFHGTATFRYTLQDNGTTNGTSDPKTNTAVVSITVTPVADAPTVSTATTAEETQSASGLVITRNAVDGAEVTHFQISAITGGRLFKNDGTTELADGSFITAAEGGAGLKFTPNPNLNTPAGNAFSFIVKAALDGAGVTGLSTGTTATIHVDEVNDAPTGVDDILADVAEDSGARTIAASDLLANDLAGANETGQTLTVTAVSGAVNGAVSLNSATGTITFTPDADFTGEARFTYTLEDNGTTAGANNNKSATAIAKFQVTEVNDDPVGADDTLADIAEDSGPRTIPFATLLANDSPGPLNENGQTLTVSTVGMAVGGTVAIDNGDVVFTPTLNFAGTASFTYTLQDNGTTAGVAAPKTDTAVATFTVTPTPDAPVAHDQSRSVIVGQTVTGTVTATDPDGDTLTYTLVNAPTKGTLTLNPDGTFTYRGNSTGTDGFTFLANDGTADSNLGGVRFDIYPTPPPPPQLVLTITSPVTDTRESSVEVSGTANPGYTIAVNGAAVQVDGAGAWKATVALATEGPNVITAVNGSLTQSVTVMRDTIPPDLRLSASAIRTDAETVTLQAATESGAIIELEGQEGQELNVTVPLKMGNNRFTATATDRAGNVTTATVTVLRVPKVAVEVPKGQPGDAHTQTFRVQLPGEAVREPLLLQVVSPSLDSAAVRAAESAALVAGTGDADATGQADGQSIDTFPAAATVTFTYDPAQVSDPSDLKIYYYDTTWKVWVELGGQIDRSTHTIIVQVEHFTTFAAMEPQADAPVLDAPPENVQSEKLTVTGKGMPNSPVTLVINGESQLTVQTDANGRFTLTGTLGAGRNWVYVKGTGVLASREYTVTYLTGNYTDIDGYWAEAVIRRLAQLGILTLYPEPLFQPTEKVTRLEFAVMVARVLNLPAANEAPTFTDTDAIPLWARPEVAAAVKAGIIKGLPDGSFAPNAYVTRAEMAVMLTRALQYAGKETSPGHMQFADGSKIPGWAKDQVLAAARHGLITGYPDGTFGAGNNTTRGEAVTMLNRLLDAVSH